MKPGWRVAVALLAGVTAAAAEPQAVAPPEAGLVPLARTAPQYPRAALRDGVEGFVDFMIVVKPDGRVKSAVPVASSPRGVFEWEAEQAIRQWRFAPRVVDGQPVEGRGYQRIEFKTGSAYCSMSQRPPRPEPYTSDAVFAGMEAAVKLVQAKDFAAAEKVLAQALAGSDRGYGRAMLLQMLAYVQLNLDQLDAAIASYDGALATEALPWTLHEEIRFYVARLQLGLGRRQQARQSLDRYFAEACEPSLAARELQAELNISIAPAPAPAAKP